MQLNPSEISDLIKKKIENFDAQIEAHSEGTVVSVTDGIVRVVYQTPCKAKCWSSPAVHSAWH
jgi:F0F1-type ATP synthase alpha subunit